MHAPRSTLKSSNSFKNMAGNPHQTEQTRRREKKKQEEEKEGKEGEGEEGGEEWGPCKNTDVKSECKINFVMYYLKLK